MALVGTIHKEVQVSALGFPGFGYGEKHCVVEDLSPMHNLYDHELLPTGVHTPPFSQGGDDAWQLLR